MDEKTKKIISDQMMRLPDDVKQAIISVDYKTKLQEITKRQRLLIDQAGKLEMETTLVMIGLEPLDDYVANLQREMNLPYPRAKEVALDVSENIFKSIRDSLHQMNTPVEKEEKDLEADEMEGEEKVRFTNSNEANLNRDQILSEIENPSSISGGDRSMDFAQKKETVPASTELEVRPAQGLETIPGQTVKDISRAEIGSDIFQTKMTKPTVIDQQIVEAKPEVKLPEVKKRPYSGVDPYKEPLT